MPGLDSEVLEQLDPELAVRRIRTDVLTDLILAPHFAAVFEHVGEALWERLEGQLRSGTFEPSLPVVLEAPKAGGITRPGAILPPFDRLTYQLLVDLVAPTAELQLDRTRVFSHVLVNPDPDGRMFQGGHETWEKLQARIGGLCEDPRYPIAIRADVAAFFDRLYQHNLINLLHSSGCSAGAVNLLEKLLSAWMEKDSHGILQGMFPSDFLGNFYLCALDADLEVRGVPSGRYVDDIYMFYGDKVKARRGLTELVRSLRKEGLHLNERKTRLLESTRLLHEESELDRLFTEARDEIAASDWADSAYGFVIAWRVDEEGEGLIVAAGDEHEEEEDQGERERLLAVERLYERVDEPGMPVDRIERFCLPILGSSGSPVAIERAVRGIASRPHLAQAYATYLMNVSRDEPAVRELLEAYLDFEQFPYEWQMMWLLGVLTYVAEVERSTVSRALRIVQNRSVHPAVRAVAVQLVARHGDAGRRRTLRNLYGQEPSEYVRGAMLFAARHFPTPERRTCIGAWGGHSAVNSLIAKAVSALA